MIMYISTENLIQRTKLDNKPIFAIQVYVLA